MPYFVRYTESHSASTVSLPLRAETDAQAVAELRDLVGAGYRNEASAQVELQGGRTYGATNRHGMARGGYMT